MDRYYQDDMYETNRSHCGFVERWRNDASNVKVFFGAPPFDDFEVDWYRTCYPEVADPDDEGA